MQSNKPTLTLPGAKNAQPSVPTAAEPAVETLPPTPSKQTENTLDAVGSREFIKLQEDASEDNRRREFERQLAEAYAPPEAPPPAPPPVAPQITAQTKAEMEAGKKMVAEYAKTEAQRQRIVKEHQSAQQGGTEVVFRPGDYVPDPRKNQGHTNARSVG